MKSLLLLGSTGSIGTQALDIVRESAGGLQVVGLGARQGWEPLLAQCREFAPRCVGLTDEAAAARLESEFTGAERARTRVFRGPDAIERMAREVDYDLALNGVVGAAGLRPSVHVLERGKTLALANKESLVLAGELLMELSREHGGTLFPVDSEHCGIFQCLGREHLDRVRCVYLTASGGALRDLPQVELADVTPELALAHPNWSMGERITIDSATLMNKALEVIEAHHLYGLEAERIRVVMHRQSIVHALVEYVDGSVLAQMGPPDMRQPIHQALYHPERTPSNLRGFDLELFRNLSFDAPDPERFPALALGYRCLELGRDAGCVLNAADEVAVQAFLDRKIGFQDIHAVNRTVLETPRPALPPRSANPSAAPTVELATLLEADQAAREAARLCVEELSALHSSSAT